MDVVVPILARFFESSDDQIYPHRETVDTEFWERYLNVYDRVIVLARVSELTDQTEYANDPIDHDSIEFVSIPDFDGPVSFSLRIPQILQTIRNIYSEDLAYILRIPDPLSFMTSIFLDLKEHPYGVEVCADAENSFDKNAYEHPLRPVIQSCMTKAQTRVCAHANAISYVTEWSLQEKYPPNPEAYETHYSSIHLTDEFLVKEPKSFSEPLSSPRIISVGGLEQLYKAPDVMLDSIAQLNKKDISPHLLWLGGGKYREEMIDRAKALGITDQVDFPGRVNSERVKAELSRSDLFVLPSRMEGLPRAMIEAMARGLPCIGTNVDGIPELVDTHCTVPPNDSEALAEAIHDLAVDPDEMSQQAAQNLQKAKEYHHDILSTRREDLYLHLYKQTQEFSEDNNG